LLVHHLQLYHPNQLDMALLLQHPNKHLAMPSSQLCRHNPKFTTNNLKAGIRFLAHNNKRVL
jgi:hypothetical protein